VSVALRELRSAAPGSSLHHIYCCAGASIGAGAQESKGAPFCFFAAKDSSFLNSPCPHSGSVGWGSLESKEEAGGDDDATRRTLDFSGSAVGLQAVCVSASLAHFVVSCGVRS
jgi:hypothetical protein